MPGSSVLNFFCKQAIVDNNAAGVRWINLLDLIDQRNYKLKKYIFLFSIFISFCFIFRLAKLALFRCNESYKI